MLPSDVKNILPLLTTLAVPYALVLAAPGPNLLVIARASIVPSLSRPIAAALGIACGATIASAIAAYSASWIVSTRGLEFWGTLVFSAVLVNSGLRLLYREPGNHKTTAQAKTRRNASLFTLGLLAALSNPMTIPFFVSFFVATPVFQTFLGAALACALIFMMAGLWFASVGFLFSISAGHNMHGEMGRIFRCILACLMIGYAIVSVCRHLQPP